MTYQYELYTLGDLELHPLVRYGYLSEKEFDVFTEVAGRRHTDFEAYTELCTAIGKDNLPFFSAVFVPERELLPHVPTINDRIRGRRRTIVKLPRSHSKSTQWNIDDNVHTICYAAIGEMERPRILNIQETGGEAEKTVGAVRNILYRGWNRHKDEPRNLLGQAFGNFEARTVRRLPDLLELNIGDEITKEPTIEGVGVGGAITGAHPTRCKIDDPTSEKNSRTEGARELMWNWHTKTVVGLLDPGTIIDVLCTPKYEEDYPHRLEGTKKYNVQKYPAVTRFPDEEDYEVVLDDAGDIVWVKLTKRGYDGSEREGLDPLRALWPCPQGRCPNFECAAGLLPGIGEHRSVEYMIFDKLLDGRAGFAQEFMLEPYAPGEAPIKHEMIRAYCMWHEECWGAPDPWSGQPIQPFPWDPQTKKMRPDSPLIEAGTHAWDHAIGMKRRNDETAHCFAPDTEIEGAFTGALKVHYDGPMRVLVTASGKRLRVTPNHPIMTSEGWIPAGEIHPGRYLVRHTLDVKMGSGSKEDDQNGPLSIEQVWKAFPQSWTKLPTARDLHGDAMFGKGEIDVAGTIDELRYGIEPQSLQPASDVILEGSDMATVLLSRQRNLVKGLGGEGFATPRVAEGDHAISHGPSTGGPGQTISRGDISNLSELPKVDVHRACGNTNLIRQILDACPGLISRDEVVHVEMDTIGTRSEGILKTLRLGAIAQRNDLPQVNGDRLRGDTSLLAQIIETAPSLVALDEVIEVKDFSYTGEVYDASTIHGYYWAVGLLVSNCRMFRTADNHTWSITEGGHWEPSDVIEMMEVRFQTEEIHKPFTVVTEAINFQRIFGQQVQEHAESVVPIEMITAAKDKFTSLVESGYFNQLMSGRHHFDVHDPATVEQHLRFTGGRAGGKDDRVDSNRLAFGPLMSRQRKRARTWGRPRAGRLDFRQGIPAVPRDGLPGRR